MCTYFSVIIIFVLVFTAMSGKNFRSEDIRECLCESDSENEIPGNESDDVCHVGIRKMDPCNIKIDSGTAEYYLNRLIQRAIVEPKPLIKIYEEECQRHPDISVTVTFKEFQAALQRHCMTLQSRTQPHVAAAAAAAAAAQYRPPEQNHHHKPANARYNPLNDFSDPRRRRPSKRPESMQSHSYQRMPLSVLERFSPLGMSANNLYHKTATPQASASVNVKTEESTYPPSTSSVQLPTPPVSRPPSLQPPVEEEAPPEFIEMSTNPIMADGSQFPGMFQGQLASEQNITAATAAACKTEPKDSESGGTVQSSSPLNKNSLLSLDDGSPLNVRCVKCITALVTCAVMPCGHCCLCNICGQTALSLKQVCPVCRKCISTVIGYSNLIYNVYR